jgi:hypothetical protein
MFCSRGRNQMARCTPLYTMDRQVPLGHFRNSHHPHLPVDRGLGMRPDRALLKRAEGWARRMGGYLFLYLFLAGFFAGGGELAVGAGGALCSGTLASVNI